MTKSTAQRGIFILCIVSLLCGCNDEEKAFEKCQKEALANQNVWSAYLQVKGDYEAYTRGFTGLRYSNDIAGQYLNLATKLFSKALDQHNLDALNAMFESKCSLANSTGCDFIGKIPDNVPVFLSKVDKLPGKKSDIKFLLTAAQVYDEGHWVIKDSNHAVALYARAWAAGAVYAPKNLWEVFTELKEPASAYLWGIRCTGSCSISTDELNALAQSSLTAKQIRLIQQLAKDNSIVTVNGLASREDLK